MKKIYVLAGGFLLAGSLTLKAQDTLIYESFNYQSFYDNLIDAVPLGGMPGNTIDLSWYNWDQDGQADGSSSATARPGGWFASAAFADVDTLNQNAVIIANSWFADITQQAFNWLVMPSIQLGTHDTLFWKSAPFETPRYLDGYKVYLSTGDNSDGNFLNPPTGHLIYSASEMTALSSTIGDTVFADFEFSTPGYIHGYDGTYIQTPADVDETAPEKTAFRGMLRPNTIPLDDYANQKIFIAFLHDSHDDNLISLDDIMIRGSLPESGLGIHENKNDLGVSVFPNPASDNAQVNYNLSAAETNVVITIYDIAGKVIANENKGSQQQGSHFTNINTADLAKGFYTVSVKTANNISTTKLVIK